MLIVKTKQHEQAKRNLIKLNLLMILLTLTNEVFLIHHKFETFRFDIMGLEVILNKRL